MRDLALSTVRSRAAVRCLVCLCCDLCVRRLITKGTLEEKIMGLQRFKLSIANSIVNEDNARSAPGPQASDSNEAHHITTRSQVFFAAPHLCMTLDSESARLYSWFKLCCTAGFLRWIRQCDTR